MDRIFRRIIIIFAVFACAVVIFAIGSKLIRDRFKVSYPVEYKDTIINASEEFGVPSDLIASVIMAESSYDPNAVSSVGAIGLMQIMPETGEWISGKFGDEYVPFDADMLYTPEINIRFGSWYLGWLIKRYEGDALDAVCAYTMGFGNVDAWLENAEYSSDGVSLSLIPSDRTNIYVNNIKKYREFYKDEYSLQR